MRRGTSEAADLGALAGFCSNCFGVGATLLRACGRSELTATAAAPGETAVGAVRELASELAVGRSDISSCVARLRAFPGPLAAFAQWLEVRDVPPAPAAALLARIARMVGPQIAAGGDPQVRGMRTTEVVRTALDHYDARALGGRNGGSAR